MAQQFRALAALPEGLIIPSNHTAVHNHPLLQFQGIRNTLLAPSVTADMQHTGIHTCRQSAHTHKRK